MYYLLHFLNFEPKSRNKIKTKRKWSSITLCLCADIYYIETHVHKDGSRPNGLMMMMMMIILAYKQTHTAPSAATPPKFATHTHTPAAAEEERDGTAHFHTNTHRDCVRIYLPNLQFEMSATPNNGRQQCRVYYDIISTGWRAHKELGNSYGRIGSTVWRRFGPNHHHHHHQLQLARSFTLLRNSFFCARCVL